MAYKYSAGRREFGDIDYEGDDNTQIDFDDDYIGLVAGGNSTLIVSGSSVGIGTATPNANELLTLDGVDGDHECNIQFREDGTNRAKVGINDSNNLVFHNQTPNKHIVFKVNDGGVTREGIRINGAVPEVVVNESSDSLVDFRVESDSNTHMLFVDGAANTVGINTSNPTQLLDINGDAIRIRSPLTPSSASDLGEAGMVCWDANYLYVCVATDTWKRIPLDSW